MSRFPPFALYVIGVLALSTAATAQDLPVAASDESQNGEEVTRKLDQIVVTGSHIKRIEIEGPLPISTIEREELLARGEVSLSDAIRDLPYNSFGSAADVPNSDIPNASLPRLRGLGSKYTLSLLDGHRLPGFAAIDGGAASSLTGIPLAAIDRVEVLRDGASAVYGSDAIGGVINMLTRRDNTEPEFEIQLHHPQQDGGGVRRASLVFGRNHGRGDWLLAAERFDREILLGKDRDYLIALAGFSGAGNPGSFRRFDPETGDYVGPRVADDRCPTAFDSSPRFPSSALFRFGPHSRCVYRFRDLNAERAGYEASSVFAKTRFEIDEYRSAYARLLAIDADSLTQLAPSPAIGLVIAADNPNNPTRGELGPGLGYPLELDYRLTSLGPRVNRISEFSLHTLVGMQGEFDWAEGGDWNLSLSHNRLDHEASFASGYALQDAFQSALESGRFDPFSAEPDQLSGLEDALYSPWTRSQSRSTSAELATSVDAGFLRNLSASYAFGLDLTRSEYGIDADPELLRHGVLGFFGTLVQESASRNHGGIYSEMFLPFAEQWEVSLAARYDHYQGAGGAVSPKLALAFRPDGHWLVRAALGKGFQAPDLPSAFGSSFGFDANLIDLLDCFDHPDDEIACQGRPVTVVIAPNAELQPERGHQASIGLVWQPLDVFELALDFYRIRITDKIATLEAEDALELELECRRAGQACDTLFGAQIIRDQFNNLDTIILPFINVAGTDTRGIDLELGARHATRFGDFRFDLRASKVLDYDFSISREISFGVVGSINAPPWRSQARLGWEYGSHGLSLGAKYIASRGYCRPAVLPDGTRNPDCEDRISSYTELDAQWRWKSPWGGEIALGGRNLGNRPPPHDFDGNYLYGLYDPNGRVWYVRYSQRF